MINLLFLAPKLLEFLLLEIVEFALRAFLDGLFGLALPVRSVSAGFKIGLEIAQCRAPAGFVAQKAFGDGWNLCFWIIGIWIGVWMYMRW